MEELDLSFGLDDFSSFEEDDSEPETTEPVGDGPALSPQIANGAAVAVVDADQAVREYLAAQFGEGAGSAASLAELESRLGMGPVVVILGPSCAEPGDLATIQNWARTHPEVGAILVTSEVSTALLQSAMRAGVRDVLSAPIDQMQLQDTVERVAEGLSSTLGGSSGPTTIAGGGVDLMDELEGDPGMVITVFSTKGGSGKSVTATNIACSLARRSDRPVVLIDGHLQFGDVAVMLKLQPTHTVVDAITQLDKLDAILMQELMTTHEETGLRVLPAPMEPTFADQITGEQMVQLADVVKRFAGHVIIDLPAYFNDVVLSLIEASDEVVMVAGLDIPNIKNVKIGLSTLQLLDIPKERLHLILNRSDSKVKLDVNEVEKTLQVRAAARVPSDVVVPISVNKGSPVVVSYPKSNPARAFEEFAMRFLDGQQLEAQQPSRRRFFGG
ncbi:MAG: P-loop NTPase [Acidimicrobiales bacterium]|nr:P-loop NTPase [Acidimicrobiales bacterium]